MALEALAGCEFVHQLNRRRGCMYVSAQVITRISDARQSTSTPTEENLTLTLALILNLVLENIIKN